MGAASKNETKSNLRKTKETKPKNKKYDVTKNNDRNKLKANLKGKENVVKCVLLRKSKRVLQKTKKVQFSPETLKCALKELEGGISYRTVSEKFGIPISTLCRKKKNPDKVKVSHGPVPILSDVVEKDIVTWIIQRAAIGQPVTKTLLLDNVQLFLNDLKAVTPFKDNRPSRHWYEAFRRRHPEITVRTAQYLTQARAQATEEVLREWYQEVKEYLEKNNLLNIDGSRIFNCDETNVQLCPKPDKVLTLTGASNVYKRTDSLEKESLTALIMYNALGIRAPPMVLYNYANRVPPKIVKECPSDWGIGVTETG